MFEFSLLLPTDQGSQCTAHLPKRNFPHRLSRNFFARPCNSNVSKRARGSCVIPPLAANTVQIKYRLRDATRMSRFGYQIYSPNNVITDSIRQLILNTTARLAIGMQGHTWGRNGLIHEKGNKMWYFPKLCHKSLFYPLWARIGTAEKTKKTSFACKNELKRFHHNESRNAMVMSWEERESKTEKPPPRRSRSRQDPPASPVPRSLNLLHHSWRNQQTHFGVILRLPPHLLPEPPPPPLHFRLEKNLENCLLNEV